jgi:hypothetical protein
MAIISNVNFEGRSDVFRWALDKNDNFSVHSITNISLVIVLKSHERFNK